MIAYLDIPAGLSGDIFLGCLVSAGWSVERLRDVIFGMKLPVDEWAITERRVMKGAVEATLVDVRAKEGHVHRGLADVAAVIDAGDLPPEVKARATRVFHRLAEAEAKVHGTTVDKIHFHEVGAVDAIIDIVGCVAGLHELGVAKLYAGPVPLGSGWTKSAHGQIPIPAPATLELLAAAKAKTCPGPGPGELTTPTAVALVSELAEFRHPPLRLDRIGTGAGQRDCPWPNVARLWLGHEDAAQSPLVEVQTNIDDMNPQLYAGVTDKLFDAGAKDVWLTPVQMKKGRPAIVISALGPAAAEQAMTHVLLTETTTLGVRVHALKARHEADREMARVDTPFGQVQVKLKRLDGRILGAMPEFEDCRTLAAQHNLPARQVWESALAAARRLADSLNPS